MRMLRWMCDKTRNANIRDMVGFAPIEDKVIENRFMWFGHICRKCTNEVVRRSDMVIGSDNTRQRRRPKLTLDAVVRNDMIGLNFGKHLALDRAQWRKMIYVADPN